MSDLVIDLRGRIEKPIREESAAAIEKVKAESEKERDRDREALERERSHIKSEARKAATANERHLQARRVASFIGKSVERVLLAATVLGVFAALLRSLGVFEVPLWIGVVLLVG